MWLNLIYLEVHSFVINLLHKQDLLSCNSLFLFNVVFSSGSSRRVGLLLLTTVFQMTSTPQAGQLYRSPVDGQHNCFTFQSSDDVSIFVHIS